ncbi:hypothetical protein [Occallatibacter savannae]|uniref:hypothetical protein n=1 Tax=Occallatibacter savannae TaxID=1002691 RepID=UPI000D69F7DC|nr:hypothetical protein [Occallatibacter savannae]
MSSPRDSLRFEGVHCSIRLERAADSVILLDIKGTDTGELGEAPMRALEEWLGSSGLGPNRPMKLFIDARAVRGASIDVSSEWAAWLKEHRGQLESVTMLTGSKFIQVTAEFVRRFADLNGIMWVCTEPAVFDLAMEQARRP